LASLVTGVDRGDGIDLFIAANVTHVQRRPFGLHSVERVVGFLRADARSAQADAIEEALATARRLPRQNLVLRPMG
jgi:hypothetical protein